MKEKSILSNTHITHNVAVRSTHAKLSASASSRWLNCPASVKAEEGLPDSSSPYAFEGTVAHRLAEFCLTENCDAENFLNTRCDAHTFFSDAESMEAESLLISKDMCDHVQDYLNYVRGLKGQKLVERRVDFSEYAPEGFGTADHICFSEGLLTITDFKYGQGVRVDAKENSQLMLYGLGVLNEFDTLDRLDTVRLVIYQPRLDHVDEWMITCSDLLTWGEVVKKRSALALSDNAPFNPGAVQCRWCKAVPTCSALAGHALAIIDKNLDDFDHAPTPQAPETMSKALLAYVLDNKKLISDWLNKVSVYAYDSLTKNPDAIPGYKLVAGRSSRSWRDAELAEKKLRNVRGLRVGDIFKKRLISAPQAETLLGKNHRIIKQQIYKPEGKPVMVLESDTRPAVDVRDFQDFDYKAYGEAFREATNDANKVQAA